MVAIDCEGVLATTKRAAQAVLKLYGGDVRTEIKPDKSPVTEADLQSNEILVSYLQRSYPDIPIISEELPIPDYETRKSWTRFWLLDPLDGTKEFLQKTDQFTINVALVEDGAPVLGILAAPALNLVYFAQAGQGTWKQIGKTPPEQIYSSQSVGQSGHRVVVSGPQDSPRLADYLGSINVKERVKVGSALKFAYLAEDKADLYPRFHPCMEWDIAAGDCLFRYAAREGTNSSPLTYNNEELHVPPFVVGIDVPEESC